MEGRHINALRTEDIVNTCRGRWRAGIGTHPRWFDVGGHVGARARPGFEHFVQGEWNSQIAAGFDGANLDVQSLLLDRRDALWIGTTDKGLYRIFEDRVEHYDSKDGLSSDLVERLFEDREGNVWAVTSKGIDRFRDMRITSFSTLEGLCTNEVDSVLAAQDGTLWIGGDGPLAALRHGAVACWVSGKGLPGVQVTSMFEDQAHHLWVGLR